MRRLIWLLTVGILFFLGGPGPSCADVTDVDDDGGIDMADPVFGLEYLFLGTAEPPVPGPRLPGFDGTPTDPFTCGDPPPSILPGVSFDLSGNPDTMTLGEAAAGVRFQYEVVIEKDLEGVVPRPLDAGRCDQPDASGLRILERISGDDPRSTASATRDFVFQCRNRRLSGPADTRAMTEREP